MTYLGISGNLGHSFQRSVNMRGESKKRVHANDDQVGNKGKMKGGVNNAKKSFGKGIDIRTVRDLTGGKYGK